MSDSIVLRSFWIKISTIRNVVRLIATLFVLAIFPSALHAVELLANPGFEGAQPNMSACPSVGWGGAIVSGIVAPGWSDNSCWQSSAASITYSKDSTPANLHGGTASQKMQVTGPQGILVQSVQFVEATYSGKVWLRVASPMNVTLQLRQASGGYYPYGQNIISIPAADINLWKEYRVAGLAGATPGLFMVIVNSPGTLWIDDASVEKLDPPLPTTSTPAPYFGMHIHKNGLAGQNPPDTLADPWTAPAVGQPAGSAFLQRNPINAIRLWDSGGAWITACRNGPCPSPNNWDWNGIDAQVNRALANGVTEIIFTLGGITPTWASVRESECSPWNNISGGHSAEPKTDQMWSDWVTAVATRYQGKIKYWEIWNEPQFSSTPNIPPNNCSNFFTGTPAKLVTLSQLARTILKNIDPSNKVLSPSANIDKLDIYFAAGGGISADIISQHLYMVCDSPPPAGGVPWLSPSPERIYKQDIPLVRALVDRYGFMTKPIWNTEVGRGCATNLSSQSLEAAYMARSLILNQAGGIGRHYFYAWDTPPYPDNGSVSLWLANPGVPVPPVLPETKPSYTYPTLTPAGVAYREVAKWLIGNKVIEVITSPNNWSVKLQDTVGRFSYIAWNPNSSGVPFNVPAFSLPSGASIIQRDLTGDALKVTTATITPDASPVLLTQGFILDNLAPGTSGLGISYSGLWCVSGGTGSYGADSLFSANPAVTTNNCGTKTMPATYRWTAPIATAGMYEIYVRWSSASVRSTNVPFSVTYAGATATAPLITTNPAPKFNQQVGGGKWVLLGTYKFNVSTTPSNSGYVETSDVNGLAVADAVLFLPVP